MKHLQRVFALCFSLILILGCAIQLTAFADTTTDVNIRLILPQYGTYASCSVLLEQYETMTSPEPISTRQVSIGRVEIWERTIPLKQGCWKIADVFVLGSWSAMEYGNTERFEVKGDKMTVYVGVDTDEHPAKMPPQWLIYGEDTQKWWLWDGTPDLIVGNEPTAPTEPTEPTESNPIHGESLPGDHDTGVEEDPSGPNHGTRPFFPTLPDDTQKPQEPVKKSVKIGNIVFYLIIGLIFLVCLILRRKVQKERGA